MDDHETPKESWVYFYQHTNGEVIRKPRQVVEMGGGPEVYFDSPFVVRWWSGPDRQKRTGIVTKG